MPRLTSQRKLLLKVLADVGGRVEDKNGGVTALLGELMYPDGRSPKTVIGLLQAAEKDGLIIREVQGRRTYSVSLAPEYQKKSKPIPTHEIPETPEPLVDYRRIADELLDLVLERATNKAPDQTEEIARLSRSLRDEMESVQRKKHLIGQLHDEIKALKSEQFSFRQHIKQLEEQADKIKKAALQNGGRVYSEAKRAVLNDLMSAPKHPDKGG